MFDAISGFFSSSSSSTSKRKRDEDEGGLTAESAKRKRDEDADAGAAAAASAVETQPEDIDYMSLVQDAAESSDIYDQMYIEVIKEDKLVEWARWGLHSSPFYVEKFRTERSNYNRPFCAKLDLLVSTIKRYTPPEELKTVKEAENNLKKARGAASQLIPTFFFKYVSVPFHSELLRFKFEEITSESVFMARVDPLLRQHAKGDQNAYFEIKEQVRETFGTLLGHLNQIRAKQPKEEWIKVCVLLRELYDLSVHIKYIDQLRDELEKKIAEETRRQKVDSK